MNRYLFTGFIITIFVLVSFFSCEKSSQLNYSGLIDNGEFEKAKVLIKEKQG